MMLFNSGKTWSRMLALPFACCVNLGQGTFSGPQFLHLSGEMLTLNPHLKALVEFKQVDACGSTFYQRLTLSATNYPVKASMGNTASDKGFGFRTQPGHPLVLQPMANGSASVSSSVKQG